MTNALSPRAQAEQLAARLPPLLARARHLASSVELGEHGRRRAGQGDAFWQFRRAQPGDPAHRIDWRRSARSDRHYVQEKEWQAAQSVFFWVDPARSMRFASRDALATKEEAAKLMALALAALLVRGGERIGLVNSGAPPLRGEMALTRMSTQLESDAQGPISRLPARAHAVFLSDFLGDLAEVEQAVAESSRNGVHGVLFQILDPVEEAFPFSGRLIFEDMSGVVKHDTREASDLRDRYLERLAARKAKLADLARATGWRFHTYHTHQSEAAALLWLYHALEGQG